MANLAAALSGFLLAVGLAVGFMVQPAKVVGFLNVFGAWDPTLLFVMAGAVSSYALIFRWTRHRERPLFAKAFSLPTRTDVDRRLVVGAALFGCGWGLSGFCPGPGLVGLGAGVLEALIFTPSMIAGFALFGAWMHFR